jgi:hypothetical protein
MTEELLKHAKAVRYMNEDLLKHAKTVHSELSSIKVTTWGAARVLRVRAAIESAQRIVDYFEGENDE